MKTSRNKASFEDIKRYVKISFFVSSIIPLSLLVYITLKYIYPYLEMPSYIFTLLLLAVVISVLGLFLLTRTTNSSIVTLQKLYEKLNGLVNITKHLRATTYPDILLKDIVESAINLNSAESGFLLLCDENRNLRYKVASGEQTTILEDRVIKPGEGFSGWVLDTGQPLRINDASRDGRYSPDMDRIRDNTTRSVLCVPLVHDQKVIGVIELLNKKGGGFTEDDERLLLSLADQAAIAIAQNNLYEEQKSDMIHITEILVNAQDSHIPDKKGHVRRVAKYANLIGKKMGLSEEELKTLYHASLLHDVGFLNINVYEEKKEPWGKERFIQHPQLGYEMIKPISRWSDAAVMVLNHHERYDGSGYPSGKKGKEIPLGARILFVAEVFDVLTSKHSYKDTLNFEMAMAEIEANSGSQFDPEVVKAFREGVKETDLE